MRKFYLLFLVVFGLLAFNLHQINAQVNIGIRAGLSTTQLEARELIIKDQNDLDLFKIRVREVNYGVHIGLMFRLQMNSFFIQPEFLYNSHSVDYEFDEIQYPELQGLILSERFQQIDIPLMMGLKFGFFRINAGPVGHINLNSVSDLENQAGFKSRLQDLTLGYQAGIGFDIWNIHLDFRYEGNFNKYGDHITFFGQEYDFSDKPTRLIASLGFVF
jgi:hypothetical protein